MACRKPQTLIAVVTQQRSGSKWVGSLIRHRYRTIALGEIFNPDDTSILSFRSFLRDKAMGDLVGCDISHQLSRYFNEIRTYLGMFYTFDAMFNQLDWIDFGWRNSNNSIYNYLLGNDDIVVSLIRDARDIFISMKSLEITKTAHFTSSTAQDFYVDLRADHRIVVKHDEYERFRKQLQDDRDRLSLTFAGRDNFIELQYEDLVLDPEAAFKPLDQALRNFGDSIGHPLVDDISPFSNLIKTPVQYSKLIQNYDEVLSWPS